MLLVSPGKRAYFNMWNCIPNKVYGVNQGKSKKGRINLFIKNNHMKIILVSVIAHTSGLKQAWGSRQQGSSCRRLYSLNY